MEWIKHKTAAHEDPAISDAMDEFGDAGYAFYFILLEIYGKEYNNTDSEGWLRVSMPFLKRKLRKSSAKVQLLFNFYQKKAKINFKIEGKDISFQIPKFVYYASTWAKRKKTFPQATPPEAPLERPHNSHPIEPEVRSKNKEVRKENNQDKTEGGVDGYVYHGDKLKIKTAHHVMLSKNFPDYHLQRIYREIGLQAAERGETIVNPIKFITKCIGNSPDHHKKSRLDNIDYREWAGMEVPEDATP